MRWAGHIAGIVEKRNGYKVGRCGLATSGPRYKSWALVNMVMNL
jgi:hypothetical protein